MAAGLIHECIAKRLEDYIHVGANEFYVGSVAPDSWRNSDSKKDKTHFYIDGVEEPRYDIFFNKYSKHFGNEFLLGYFIHLIADYYWYSHSFTNIKDGTNEYKKELYALYDKYDLKPIELIKKDFFNPVEELSSSGINKTIEFINSSVEECDITNVDISKIESEIKETVSFIKDELKRYNIKREYHFKFKNIFKHLHTINKHRWNVFKLCCKAGIPVQGLLHDLSKYSPIEFFEGVKYFTGGYSPIVNCKRDKGYSEAWLHHKGRNKHHFEYWYDYSLPNSGVLIPLKYFKEMVCDTFAAGIVYQGKTWTKEFQYSYWKKTSPRTHMHPTTNAALTDVYKTVAKEGLDAVLNKKELERIYYKHINKKYDL